MNQIKDYLAEEELKGLAEILQPHIASQKNDINAIERKSQLIAQYGSTDNFLNKLEFELVSSPDSPHLASIYPVFESSFKNPLEKESVDAMKLVLSEEFSKQFIASLGNYKTAFIVAKVPATQELIGGIFFDNYFFSPEFAEKTKSKGTSHIEYIFVEPTYRKTGLGQELYKKMSAFSHNLFAGMTEKNALNAANGNKVANSNIYLFADVEAPELVLAEEGFGWYAQKPEILAEQLLRLAWWNKAGFKRIDFPFIQSPLEQNMDPCKIFSMNVKYEGNGPAVNGSIAANVVKEHIKRYLTINVLKGRNPETDEHYVKQMQQLDDALRLKTFEIGRVYEDVANYSGMNLFCK